MHCSRSDCTVGETWSKLLAVKSIERDREKTHKIKRKILSVSRLHSECSLPPPMLPPLPVMLRTLSSALVAFIQRDKFWFVSFLLSLCSYPLPHSLSPWLTLSLLLSKRHFKFCALENLSPFAYHICHRPLDAHTQSSHVPVSVPMPLLLLCVCVYVSLVNFIILCRVGFVVVCGKDVRLTLGDIINIKRRNRSEAADNKY